MTYIYVQHALRRRRCLGRTEAPTYIHESPTHTRTQCVNTHERMYIHVSVCLCVHVLGRKISAYFIQQRLPAGVAAQPQIDRMRLRDFYCGLVAVCVCVYGCHLRPRSCNVSADKRHRKSHTTTSLWFVLMYMTGQWGGGRKGE